ncbi:MAG: paraquat-inducible protein A [Pirellulaceae bacterium]|nr:paraquat-inducible protein A [Pirellulaceae bacterium]
MSQLQACHCCGKIHAIPPLDDHHTAHCTRCAATIVGLSRGGRAASRTAALALGAFFLYWPAILLPILQIEQLGHRHSSSLLTGTMELLHHGSWFVGLVVLVFSVVFPLTKILLLLELSLLGVLHRRHKALTYRVMELVGKWSMMDVLLLAFMVMLVKLGALVKFEFGPAVVAFVLCVAMSIASSIAFDPHAIWESESE